jgi:hypothetical protein
MKIYEITVPVEGYEYYSIEAESEQDAKDQILNGLADCYSREDNIDTDSNNWKIEEAEIEKT